MSEAPVCVVLGTMTMGPAMGDDHVKNRESSDLPAYCQTPPEDALEQLRIFTSSSRCALQKPFGVASAGQFLVDTAAIYQNNHTERVLGKLLAENLELKDKISLHTKVHHAIKPHKSYSTASIKGVVEQSLTNLQVPALDLLYFHAPHIDSDLEESLSCVNDLFQQGKLREFGLSNYPAWAVADICHICDKKGWVKPTVYQGCYNAISRTPESELFPVLRRFGLRGLFYNPLAGGMLTGKYKALDDASQGEGRFGAKSPISGAAYSARYWKQGLFDALEIVRAACDLEGIPMVEAALRWCLHHSCLSGEHGDGIILGASKSEQAKQNVEACEKGPLPASIVEAYERAWDASKSISDPYFRDYGSAPGKSGKFLKKYQRSVPYSLM